MSLSRISASGGARFGTLTRVWVRSRRRSRHCPGLEIIFDACKPTVDEVHGDALPHFIAGPSVQAVDVDPSILVERIDKERCPQDEAHLAMFHADLELAQHLLIDDVSCWTSMR